MFTERNDIAATQHEEQRKLYFSKGRPCFRASPLTKTYGWIIHADAKGNIARDRDYKAFINNLDVQKEKDYAI